MLLGSMKTVKKDTKHPQVASAVPHSETRKISGNALVRMNPVRLSWGRTNGGKSQGETEGGDKENSPQGDVLWSGGEKRGLRVPGLQPLVPIGDEGH